MRPRMPPAEARMNRAISAIYEPGSTFKLVTLAAAFDQNLIRPEERFDCENGSLVVGGRRIHDHKGVRNAHGFRNPGEFQ